MDTAADIHAQIAADTHLQTEISHALLAVADTLASGSDPRVVRILTRTLVESWAVHVSFQDEVLFPILASRHGPQVGELIGTGQLQHAGLAQQHMDISRQLDDILNGGVLDRATLESLLRTTHERRLSHLILDAQLARQLPEQLTSLERSLWADWTNAHPHPRFPLSLLGHGSRILPRLTGRVN